MRRPSNILWLGLKELRSLASDPVLVVFILYAFSLSIITQARGVKSEVNNASLAFIDEDESQLSKELIAVILPAAIPAPPSHRARRRHRRHGPRPLYVHRRDPDPLRVRPPPRPARPRCR